MSSHNSNRIMDWGSDISMFKLLSLLFTLILMFLPCGGSMTHNKHKLLEDLLGFTMSSPPFLYLGDLIFIGRPKTFHFQSITDRIGIKLNA